MRSATTRLVTGLIMGLIATASAHAGENNVQKGFAIAPVPLNLAGKNVALVGEGSYLVNGVAGCNDCHTWPSYAEGGNPFLGQPKRINTERYMAGGRFFFAAPYPASLRGCVQSRNLTPRDGKPGGFTYAQWSHIMRTGEDARDTNVPPRLLQVMPWPVHQDMTDRDLRAIYEYLSAIPPIAGFTPCPS